MLFNSGNQRVAWKIDHIHHAAAEDHHIRVEEIYAGGNGSGCMI